MNTAISDTPERPTKDGASLGLLVVWAILLFGGLSANRWLSDAIGPTLGAIGRLGSSITLVILAFALWSKSGPRTRGYGLLIALGMTFGTIGDFFMAGRLGFLGLPNQSLGGMAAFGIGHLMYMTGMLKLLKYLKPLNVSKMLSSVLVWQLIGLVGWVAIVYGATENIELKWPALGYTLFLAGTAGIALAVASHRSSMWPLALGAGLFLLSDLILGIEMFRGSIPFRESVWLTYGPGQMLIVLSSWIARQFD